MVTISRKEQARLNYAMKRAVSKCETLEDAAATYIMLFGVESFSTTEYKPGEEAFVNKVGDKFDTNIPISCMRGAAKFKAWGEDE